jgi:hypothetical protein
MPTSTSTLPLPSTVPGLSKEAARILIAKATRHLPRVKSRGRPRHFTNGQVIWLTLYHLYSGIDISDLALRE